MILFETINSFLQSHKNSRVYKRGLQIYKDKAFKVAYINDDQYITEYSVKSQSEDYTYAVKLAGLDNKATIQTVYENPLFSRTCV